MTNSGISGAVSRRGFLAASAGVALAGCLGSSGGSATPNATIAATATPTATSSNDGLRGHPAAAALGDQPVLGPDPYEAGAVVVAFEDPSCPRCRAFERQTVPKLIENMVEPGRGAFVFRGYPVVYPWGAPATHALEATYARSPGGFWALAEHYFDAQPEFNSDNVYSKTEAFLSANTDLDAAAIVRDAESGAFDEAVQTDLDAGQAAGAGRTTPTVFLFRDGQYVTRAAGSVGYSVIKSALGL